MQQPKYSIGQEVYIIRWGHIEKKKITNTREHSPWVPLYELDNLWLHFEAELYATKEDIIKDLP